MFCYEKLGRGGAVETASGLHREVLGQAEQAGAQKRWDTSFVSNTNMMTNHSAAVKANGVDDLITGETQFVIPE